MQEQWAAETAKKAGEKAHAQAKEDARLAADHARM
jgi:hypothetical protein